MDHSLEDYRSRDGDGFIYDGAYYDTAVELVHVGFLGFCMCHDAAANLAYIRGGLAYIAQGQAGPPDMTLEKFRAWHHVWYAEGLAFFGTELAREFFFFWADSEGFTEHGTAIPGWVTAKGQQLMANIDAALAAEGA